MHLTELREELGRIDIYLLDLILKGTYAENARVLDAGSGGGRNSTWLLNNGYDVVCIDRDATTVDALKAYWTTQNTINTDERFLVGELDALPFSDNDFDHIICSAVLHFAENHAHFEAMISELVRVLKPGGTLFIRMTSDVGIESKITMSETGVVRIPDGSDRYLITRESLNDLLTKYNLTLAAPFKNVNVEDVRVMSVVVLRKE
ncbi:MAG: class I SAM-dependent methyltransferase [Bacteroidetes bacterium]|nr:MAG: class I SAM-dependent methyltransferase [Bacteroidota bacterium]